MCDPAEGGIPFQMRHQVVVSLSERADRFGCLVGWLVDWLLGCLVVRLVGRLVGWLVVKWLIG